MKDIFRDSQLLRDKIINDSPSYSGDKVPLSVAYFWPTKYCPIGCEHCMFASPKKHETDGQGGILSPKAVDNFVQISHEADLHSLVVSGGGEPMTEMPTIVKLMKNAHYKYFEIITGAHWTASDRLIRRNLDDIQKALSDRRSSQHGDDFDFSLRVSVDSYHQQVVKLPWLKRLVDIYRADTALPVSQRNYPDINLFFRTLLIQDDTVDQFAHLLGGDLSDMENYIRKIKLPQTEGQGNGIDSLTVFYKDMRFVGRGSDASDDKLMTFDQYFASYSDNPDSDVRLGMTYLKPGSKGEALSGINVFVTYDGKMMPYGGTPDVSANIYEDTYDRFLERLFQDNISRTLLTKGLRHVQNYAEEVDPEITERIRRKNWLASVADESLSTAAIRLYITIRLLQDDIAAGIQNADSLPGYAKDLISMQPDELRKEYLEHIKSSKVIVRNYGNELVEKIDLIN